MEGVAGVNYTHAILAAIVLAVVNTLIRPVLSVISLPITILSFGLFSLVITAFMVEIMDYFVRGIDVKSFWWALLFGIIVSVANSSIDRMLTKPRRVKNGSHEEYADYEEIK